MPRARRHRCLSAPDRSSRESDSWRGQFPPRVGLRNTAAAVTWRSIRPHRPTRAPRPRCLARCRCCCGRSWSPPCSCRSWRPCWCPGMQRLLGGWLSPRYDSSHSHLVRHNRFLADPTGLNKELGGHDGRDPDPQNGGQQPRRRLQGPGAGLCRQPEHPRGRAWGSGQGPTTHGVGGAIRQARTPLQSRAGRRGQGTGRRRLERHPVAKLPAAAEREAQAGAPDDLGDRLGLAAGLHDDAGVGEP
jgi:hypothetical protein